MGSKINALRVTNIIITCGTSICNEETIENSTHLKASQKLDDNPSSFDDIYKSIENNYKSLEIEDLGAEINILSKLGNIENDNIYFFFSETKGGELVKKLFNETDVLKEKIGDYKYNFKTISGFTVDNENDFKTKAIPTFYAELEEIKKTEIETIMCPVGGYKALIPYASLYSMVNGWDIKYIYEDSDNIIDLKNGILGYLTIKAGINDDDFKDVIKELEKGDNSIFSQDIDFNFTNILIESTNRFIELGDLSGFSKLKTDDKNLQELIDVLSEMDIQLKLLGLRKEIFKKVISTLERINEIDNNIYSPIFNKIKTELLKYFSSSNDKYDEKNDLEFYFSCLTFYHDKNRISEEFLFFREFVVDIIQFYIFGEIKYKKFKHPDGDKTIKKDIRQYIEGSIHYCLDDNIEKKDNFQYITNIPSDEYLKNDEEEKSIRLLLKEFKNDIKKLNNLRNDIAHFSNLQYNNTFEYIEKYDKSKSLLKNQKVISDYFYNKLNTLKEKVLTKKTNTN